MSEKRGAEELYDEVYEKLDKKTKDYLKDHHGDYMDAKRICKNDGFASIKDSKERESLISQAVIRNYMRKSMKKIRS